LSLLKDSVTSGVKWSSFSQIGRQVMLWITSIIFARLLSPSDFGLFGMAVVVTGFINLFRDLGTSAAVIQRKDPSRVFLSSIFWVNLTFGLVAMFILFMIAPLAGDLYREPRVGPILKILSLTFFISAFGIVQQAILERNLEFLKLMKVEMVATASGCMVGIGAALMNAGVWSFVCQSLTMMVVSTALLWASSTWKPQIVFHWVEVKSISRYSLSLTGFNIFNYLGRNADYLLIGRYLGAQNLGYYSLAYRIMIFPLGTISSVLGRVMFPVYSKLQADDAKFRFAYLKVAGSIALISFPMMLGLWAVAKPFVLTVFGVRWSPVILLLLILAPVGLAQSLGATVGAIYQAKGRTDWMFYWGLGSGTLVVIAFVVGLAWGIVGVATAYSIVSLIILAYPSFAIPFKLIDLPMRDLGEAVWRPFIASSVMLVVMLGVKLGLPKGLPGEWVLSILISIGCLVYLVVSCLINRAQVREIMSSVIRVQAE
jgi:O-antigen/teichoic acid export membrane protein